MIRSLLVSLTLFPLAMQAITLVEEGAPVAIIVTPSHPKPAEAFAAQELQHHIRLATGAELPIVSEAALSGRKEPRVSIGETEAFRQLGIALPKPKRFELGQENYPWGAKLIGDQLFFYGVDGNGAVPAYRESGVWDATPVGTLFAVYDFLEDKLGARWIWPGASGEIVQRQPNLSLESYEKSGKPRFISTLWRSEHIYTVSSDGWDSKEAHSNYLNDERLWLLRQRFRRYTPTSSFEGLIGKRDYHRKHRNIVAMTPDGKRGLYYREETEAVKGHGWDRVAACVSAPELPQLYLDYWKKTLKSREKRGNTLIVAFSENDIPGYCFCARCRATDAKDPRFETSPYWRGEINPKTTTEMWRALSTSDPRNPSLSDRYAKFLARGLEEAKKWNPQARVYGLAYLNRREPPVNVQLHEHVIIGLVDWPYLTWTKEDNAQSVANWDGWRATGASLKARPNSTFNGHNLPVFYGHWFAELFRHGAENGMIASDLDTLTGQWSVQGPTLYAVARAHVHPEQSADAMLEEFYSAFGPAYQEVKAYFTHWKAVAEARTAEQVAESRKVMTQRWQKLGTPRLNRLMIAAPPFTPEVMSKGRELMTAAVAAAANDPEAQARVRTLELGLTNAEKTLEALAIYQQFADVPSEANRATLEAGVEQLYTFRRENERHLLQNLGWISNEERGIWSKRRLDQISNRGAAEEDADVTLDAE